MAFVKIEDIMNATEGGLNVIASYYPEAPHALSTRHKKFKIRKENTASAAIRQKEDGWYYVTDFGGDQKERNAVEICMLEENLTFGEACSRLGALFNITGANHTSRLGKPKIIKRDRKESEEPGTYSFEYKDFTKEELEIIGPKLTDAICLEYNLNSLKSFTYIKKEEVIETHSTDEYPIFVFNFESWYKIYQPNSIDKSFRFRYAGKKPSKHIFGLTVIQKEFEKRKKKSLEDDSDIKDPRLEAAYIVSGGSDGLNLRSFNHYPLWFNSESEQLDGEDYKRIMTYVKSLYYIADLDATGIKQAVKTGLRFLDVKLLWLPEKLKQYRDKRGNPRKDFKDFVSVFYKEDRPSKFNNALKKLIDISVPMKFWDEVHDYDAEGRWKGTKYFFKNTRAYHFLYHNGFGRYEMVNAKDGFVWIWKDGCVVKVLRPSDVKGFANQFLIDRQMPEDLRDLVYKTSQLGEASLTNLPFVEIDFTDADKNSQYLFFKNEAWMITKDGIERQNHNNVNRYIWEDKVIDHQVRVIDKQFEITKDPDGDYDIKILTFENQFINYLVNTSRVHWKKDLEDSFEKNEHKKAEEYFQKNQFNIEGPNLSQDEIHEQKLHLINKIYTIGYMLHKYKTPNKPWAPYAMDHKIADISESHGGSGKSIFLKSIQYILKDNHYINGRDKKKTTDDFIYHGVTEDTDFMLVDDCHSYMDYGFFFNAITGDLDVNNKNGLRYTIPFSHSPKVAFASNYPPNSLDPSLERRLLFNVFSDYYHYNKDGEYQQTRIVSDDFQGKSLFLDFDSKQWNLFFNFAANCIQFYLSHDSKFDPPMENVTKRNLLKEMGDQFRSWSEVFFDEKDFEGRPLNLDQNFSRKMAFEDFEKKTKLNRWSSTKFKKACEAFAKYNGWIFNPKDVTDDNGRIIQKQNGETVEMFHIRTTKKTASSVHEEPKQNNAVNEDLLGDDLYDEIF